MSFRRAISFSLLAIVFSTFCVTMLTASGQSTERDTVKKTDVPIKDGKTQSENPQKDEIAQEKPNKDQKSADENKDNDSPEEAKSDEDPGLSEEKNERGKPPTFLDPEVVQLFKPGQFPPKSSTEQAKIEYQLFKPTLKKGQKYPLIIWLHGYGQEELDYGNYGQLNHISTTIFRNLKTVDQYPFFIVAPKLPSSVRSWNSNINSTENAVTAAKLLIQCIEKIKSDYPIDSSRISIVGISGGATDAWEIVRLKPELFSALVSLASYREDMEGLEKLTNVSIWSFQAAGDKPEMAEALISKLNSLGGYGYLTITKQSKHDCWHNAFNKHELLKWMLDQQQGKPTTNWKWQDAAQQYWPTAVVVAFVILSYLAVRQENIRKKKQLHSKDDISSQERNNLTGDTGEEDANSSSI